MTSKFYKYIDPETGDWVSDSLSVSCENCGEEFDPRRLALGYNVCLPCGELIAREVKYCIAPVHKSNYVVVSRKSDLVGINNKTSN